MNRPDKYIYICILSMTCILLVSYEIWNLSAWLFRLLLLVSVLVTAYIISKSENKNIYISPLFLMPIVILIYSIPGALIMEARGGSKPFENPIDFVSNYISLKEANSAIVLEFIRHAFGSKAELHILQFALFLLTIANLATNIRKKDNTPHSDKILFAVLFLSSILLSMYIRSSDSAANYYGNVVFTGNVIVNLTVAVCTLICIRSNKYIYLFYSIVSVVLVLLIPHSLMKSFVITDICCFIYILLVKKVSRTTIVAFSAFVLLVGAVSLTRMAISRSAVTPSERIQESIMEPAVSFILYKTVYRQAETLYCLESVVNFSYVDLNYQKYDPYYFISVLIPRLIWPQKPNYSNGGEYAVKFCHFPVEDQKKTHHSASITLLGETFLHGGKAMATTFALLFAGIMFALAYAHAKAPSSPVPIALVGWLIDFDQPTVLYIGNGVKALIFLMLIQMLISAARMAVSRMSK